MSDAKSKEEQPGQGEIKSETELVKALVSCLKYLNDHEQDGTLAKAIIYRCLADDMRRAFKNLFGFVVI